MCPSRDRARDLVGRLALGERPLHHLVNELPALRLLLDVGPAVLGRIVLGEDLGPQLQVLALDEVPREVAEQPVGVDLPEGVVRARSVLMVATRASSHGCIMRRRFIVSAISTISSTGQAVATAMRMRLVKSSFAWR